MGNDTGEIPSNLLFQIPTTISGLIGSLSSDTLQAAS